MQDKMVGVIAESLHLETSHPCREQCPGGIPMVEPQPNIYTGLIKEKNVMERLDRIECFLKDIQSEQSDIKAELSKLAMDCIESTNLYYELSNSINGLDARIDTAMLEYVDRSIHSTQFN